MSCGQNNAMVFAPTSKQQAAQYACGGGCDSTGSIIPCPPGIGPRKNRGKVREQIKDEVLLMLGAPVIKIELDQQNLDLAVDMALRVIEDYCPRDFFSYYTFYTTPGKSVYTMPPDVGIIRNVFYKQTAQFANFANDLDGAIPIEYLYPGGAYGTSMQGGAINPASPIWGNMGEWVLYKQYENMFSRISSNIGGWEWVDDHRTIKLYPMPYAAQGVIVHYLQACKDWKAVRQEMLEGALVFAKIMLGRIRSKFTGSFGPVNSGMQLDGQALVQEGIQDKKDWEERLIFRWGDLLPITMA